MNIGIYGTSIALYNNDQPDHFITLIKEHFNARIVHTGIVQCSEERILFNLKKTKKLDLAIIFHAPPYNIFVPSWNRDITSVDKDTFNKKISVKEWATDIGLCLDPDTINQFSEFFEAIPNGAIFQLLENFNIDLENYSKAFEEWTSGNDNDIKEILLSHARQTDNETFYNELFTALSLRKKYLDHPDLQMNRYYGALIQIDQYLKSQNIKCVHFLDKESWYPKWFDFTSGPADTEIQKIQKENGPYYIGYSTSANAISAAGNMIMFNRILEMLND
jgi:hypothetical protein|tara:strand:+ start:1065 stop:1892 length:828 start_codon:yes stop_codon:yes gene_type:complete